MGLLDYTIQVPPHLFSVSCDTGGPLSALSRRSLQGPHQINIKPKTAGLAHECHLNIRHLPGAASGSPQRHGQPCALPSSQQSQGTARSPLGLRRCSGVRMLAVRLGFKRKEVCRQRQQGEWPVHRETHHFLVTERISWLIQGVVELRTFTRKTVSLDKQM